MAPSTSRQSTRARRSTSWSRQAAGEGYDQYARTIARHLDRHLPGKPNIVVPNMTGAAGMRATNWIYTIAPRDGSTIGTTQRSVMIEPLYGTKEAVFDPRKFSWISSMNDEAYIAVQWNGGGIDSIQDAVAREFPVVADGPASDDYTWPAVLNHMLGTKFKIISGYKGKAEQRLSVRHGETVALRLELGRVADAGMGGLQCRELADRRPPRPWQAPRVRRAVDNRLSEDAGSERGSRLSRRHSDRRPPGVRSARYAGAAPGGPAGRLHGDDEGSAFTCGSREAET